MLTRPEIERRYTIATVTEYLPDFKTPPRFRYEFTVNHKKYATTHSIISKIRLRLPKDMGKYMGKKFYLLFVVDDDIKYGDLLLYKPVKDSVLVPPPEAWKELPE